MHNRRWCVATLAVTLWLPAPVVGQDPILRATGLREYVHQVLDGNAGYAAARTRVAAASERIAPAGALPDPAVMLGVVAVPTPSFDFTAERMTRVPFGIRQRFPFPGKQAAATDRARADSAVAGETVIAAENQLVAAAVTAFYALAYAETAVLVWRARTVLADQAISVAQTRYETGAVPQTDVIRARLRRAELEEEGLALQAFVTRAYAGVDVLRGGRRDSLPPLVLLTQDGQPRIDVRNDSLGADALARQLTASSPDLGVGAARVQRAERDARVFDVAGRPDFTLSLEHGIRFGGLQPLTTLLLGISVPLWSGRKQGPAARAAHHETEAARQEYDDLLARLIGQLRDHLANLEALQARTGHMVDQIIPLAHAASSSALQRYQVGAVEFTTVLETQDDLFRAQLWLARLIADYGAARAQLAALVGEEWYR